MNIDNNNELPEQSTCIILYEHRGKIGDVDIITMSLSEDPTDESKWLDGDALMKIGSFRVQEVSTKTGDKTD